MRNECLRCVIYRSFPDHKGDCGSDCLLEIDWNEVERELEEYNRIGELRGLHRKASETHE